MALVGKSSRQSVLDEEASIYQTAENKTEKQKWSEMDNKTRLRYFADYYLLKCVIILAAVAGLCVVLWTILKPQKEKMIFLAVVEDSLIPEGKTALEQQMEDLFITDADTQEIRIDDTFPTGYETEAKLAAYLNAKEIDLLVTNEEHFKEMASLGSFEDLSVFMPELTQAYPELLCWTKGYVEDDEDRTQDNWNSQTDTDTNERSNAADNRNDTQQTEHANAPVDGVTAQAGERAAADMDDAQIKAYGIRITDCEDFTGAWYSDTEAVMGVIVNSQRKDHAKTVLAQFFSLAQAKSN